MTPGTPRPCLYLRERINILSPVGSGKTGGNKSSPLGLMGEVHVAEHKDHFLFGLSGSLSNFRALGKAAF